jgi:hypothetical protein
MLKPRTCEGAECRLVVGEFTDDVGLGACVREDIEEVVDDDLEISIVDVLHIVEQSASCLGAYQLVE